MKLPISIFLTTSLSFSGGVLLREAILLVCHEWRNIANQFQIRAQLSTLLGWTPQRDIAFMDFIESHNLYGISKMIIYWMNNEEEIKIKEASSFLNYSTLLAIEAKFLANIASEQIKVTQGPYNSPPPHVFISIKKLAHSIYIKERISGVNKTGSLKFTLCSNTGKLVEFHHCFARNKEFQLYATVYNEKQNNLLLLPLVDFVRIAKDFEKEYYDSNGYKYIGYKYPISMNMLLREHLQNVLTIQQTLGVEKIDIDMFIELLMSICSLVLYEPEKLTDSSTQKKNSANLDKMIYNELSKAVGRPAIDITNHLHYFAKMKYHRVQFITSVNQVQNISNLFSNCLNNKNNNESSSSRISDKMLSIAKATYFVDVIERYDCATMDGFEPGYFKLFKFVIFIDSSLYWSIKMEHEFDLNSSGPIVHLQLAIKDHEGYEARFKWNKDHPENMRFSKSKFDNVALEAGFGPHITPAIFLEMLLIAGLVYDSGYCSTVNEESYKRAAGVLTYSILHLRKTTEWKCLSMLCKIAGHNSSFFNHYKQRKNEMEKEIMIDLLTIDNNEACSSVVKKLKR